METSLKPTRERAPTANGRVIAAELSDEQLMALVQGGDRGAFAQLYDRHAIRAYRVARSVCSDRGRAEDAVQEGFLSIWRGRAGYRPELGSVQGWAMRTIRNRAVDFLRRDAAEKRPELVELNGGDPDRTADSPHDVLTARSDSDAMLGALRRLPAPQAEVIALAFFGELTHTEIATQLALPKGTVKGRMRLGLEKLRTQMDDAG